MNNNLRLFVYGQIRNIKMIEKYFNIKAFFNYLDQITHFATQDLIRIFHSILVDLTI